MFNANIAPRIIAGCLAIGGLFWSVLLLPFLVNNESDLKVRALELHLNFLALLVFGPGYLVTAAYVFRVVVTPSLGIRRAIWLLSLAVQGTWLADHLVSALNSPYPMHQLGRPSLVVAWWTGATLASFVALIIERRQIELPSVSEVTGAPESSN